jgi:alpha-D-ribose 1-methylphosphonate 5-triphosphate synthase subunit PhnL
LLEIRRETIGYVSQFLRVIPRVSTLDVVAQPLRERGVDQAMAHRRAGELLERLHIPQRLWSLPPGTFSGGEQQRVNIARGFIVDYPILLLDEPTASLDQRNASIVVELIREARQNGSAVVGIFHDAEVRNAVADRIFEIAPGDKTQDKAVS